MTRRLQTDEGPVPRLFQRQRVLRPKWLITISNGKDDLGGRKGAMHQFHIDRFIADSNSLYSVLNVHIRESDFLNDGVTMSVKEFQRWTLIGFGKQSALPSIALPFARELKEFEGGDADVMYGR